MYNERVNLRVTKTQGESQKTRGIFILADLPLGLLYLNL